MLCAEVVERGVCVCVCVGVCVCERARACVHVGSPSLSPLPGQADKI